MLVFGQAGPAQVAQRSPLERFWLQPCLEATRVLEAFAVHLHSWDDGLLVLQEIGGWAGSV